MATRGRLEQPTRSYPGGRASDRHVLPGQVFLAFHFPDAAVNELTSGWTDDVTSCPEYKVTAVSVQPA